MVKSEQGDVAKGLGVEALPHWSEEMETDELKSQGCSWEEPGEKSSRRREQHMQSAGSGTEL